MTDRPTPLVTVVLTTTLGSSAGSALQSVFDQDIDAPVQILIGVEGHDGPRAAVEAQIGQAPERMTAQMFDLGYGTRREHGGIHSGSVMRAMLTLSSRARLVAYLADQCCYTQTHLRLLTQAIGDRAWAHSQDPSLSHATLSPLPVHASSIVLDKVRCSPSLFLWATDDGRSDPFLAPMVLVEAMRQHFGEPAVVDALTVRSPPGLPAPVR